MSAIIADYQTLWCLRRSATRFNKRRLMLQTVLILVGDGALISHQISEVKALTKMWRFLMNTFSAVVM